MSEKEHNLQVSFNDIMRLDWQLLKQEEREGAFFFLKLHVSFGLYLEQ